MQASNPWVCSGARTFLPAGGLDGAGILRRLARLLHDWPDDTPLRLHPMAERLRRLLDAMAGYPEIAPGSLPFDQPFRAESTSALELTLALDAWPPLAGRHSLRTELLWLDRISRGAFPLDILPLRPDGAMWLRLVLAWLLAGLAAPHGTAADAAIILMDVLYDPQERTGEAGPIRGAAELLAKARARLLAGQEMRSGFAREGGGHRDAAVAEWLWWRRLGCGLSIEVAGRHAAPGADPERSECLVEVRFHRVQAWMAQVPDDGAPGSPDLNREDALYSSMVRGASDLLEAVVSVVRTALLRRLGAGSMLISGGARVCARCPADGRARADIEAAIWTALDRMFWAKGPLGRRFAGILGLLERQQFLHPLAGADAAQARMERQRLAWSIIPPVSVTFMENAPTNGHGEAAEPVRLPLRRRWPGASFPRRSPGGRPDRRRREDIEMSLAARLRTEIGVQSPRDRLLRLRFRAGGEDADLSQLPSAYRPFRQFLVADLNQLGALFLRPREPHLDLEAIARRSLRFSAHWLLALTRTVIELDHATLPEVLVLGGDDLVVGTRHENGDLRTFAERLYQRLRPFNDELPPCDGVSFSAGLVTGRPARYTNRAFLLDAIRLERLAKERWKVEAGGPFSDGAAARESVARWGEGRRRCLVLSAPGGVVPLRRGDPADSPPAGAALAHGAVRLTGAPFSRIAAGARACVRGGDSGDGNAPQIEVVVEEGDAYPDAALRVFAAPAGTRKPPGPPPPLCEPCAARTHEAR